VVEEAEAAVNPDSSEEPASETNTESPEVAAEATPTIMEFLMENARHVDGNPDAPITIIEFSDFK
jgi:protein-disulfide isomerase